jgi:hypothetical protein
MPAPDNVIAALKTLNDYFASLSAPPAIHDFVVGEATMFALNWNGSIDRSDNGIGAWGAHTANKEIMGVSLPEGVLIATCGFTGAWVDNKARVGKFLGENRVQAAVTKDGKTLIGDIVDAGPARWTHNPIDLTYAMAHGLGTNGRAIVSYSIINGVTGAKMEIKGWDFVNGIEIFTPGVA